MNERTPMDDRHPTPLHPTPLHPTSLDPGEHATSRRPIDPRQPRRPARGFTLIEVMVVVAIIGILAAIAYPSYTEYVRRGHRAEARTMMFEAAQYLQRFHAAHDRYDLRRDGEDVALPEALQRSPAQGLRRYDIVIAAVTATTYRIEARRAAGMNGDPCGTFTLNSIGQRGVTGATLPRDTCWR